MENYSKARTVEQPCPSPFPGLPNDTPEVRVRDGSKIRNIMRFASSHMLPRGRAKADEECSTMDVQEVDPALEKPLSQQIVFTGTGKGVSKAITCVEIMKRQVKGLHQHTKLIYRTVLEVWEPLEPGAGLDSLTVRRNVPAIWVLLSREPLDSSLPGYQAPGSFDALWAQAAKEDAGVSGGGQRPGQRRRRGGGGGGGGGSAAGGGRGKGVPGRQAGRPREQSKGQS